VSGDLPFGMPARVPGGAWVLRGDLDRICPGCGRVFAVTTKHLKQKTCSVACGYIVRPKRERYVWTDAADDVVRRGYERGTPMDQIAGQLGMTRVAVALHGRALGLRHRRVSRTLEERFTDSFIPEPNSGCWLWLGSRDRKGYGQIRVAKHDLRYATHVALEINDRSVPDGMSACHHCDNPGCVNPDHLFIGTQQDNTTDMIRKGRASKPPTAKPGQGVKELCHRGHPMSGDNLFFTSTGRGCRQCRIDRKRAKREQFIAMGLRSDGLERRDGR
jgi:ribosomal protein L37E